MNFFNTRLGPFQASRGSKENIRAALTMEAWVKWFDVVEVPDLFPGCFVLYVPAEGALPDATHEQVCEAAARNRPVGVPLAVWSIPAPFEDAEAAFRAYWTAKGEVIYRLGGAEAFAEWVACMMEVKEGGGPYG